MPRASLDRDDKMEAVTQGVREGIVELGTSGGRFDIPHELLYDAVRQGVRDAIWRIATNASDMPSGDFYESVQAGVRAAIKDLQREEN